MTLNACKRDAFYSLRFGDLSDEMQLSIQNPTSSKVISFHPNIYSKLIWGRSFLKISAPKVKVVPENDDKIPITDTVSQNDQVLKSHQISNGYIPQTSLPDQSVSQDRIHDSSSPPPQIIEESDLNDQIVTKENYDQQSSDSTQNGFYSQEEFKSENNSHPNGLIAKHDISDVTEKAEHLNLEEDKSSSVKAAKPVMWSQLFSGQKAKSITVTAPPPISLAEESSNRDELIALDQFTFEIDSKLRQVRYSNLPRVVHLNPRGLNNFGNQCFMHSALQALVNLPQFYYMLVMLPNRTTHDLKCSTTPILDSLKEFVSNFKVYKSDNRGKQRQQGKAMSEFSIESPFSLMKSLLSHKIVAQGQQEDVEEFLFSILGKSSRFFLSLSLISWFHRTNFTQNYFLSAFIF